MGKTESGWRRFPVVKAKNGRVQKGAGLVNGKPVKIPSGHFELRFYEGRQARYKNVGDDPVIAMDERERMELRLRARETAAAAGVTITEPDEERETIKRELKRWVQDAR